MNVKMKVPNYTLLKILSSQREKYCILKIKKNSLHPSESKIINGNYLVKVMAEGHVPLKYAPGKNAAVICEHEEIGMPFWISDESVV